MTESLFQSRHRTNPPAYTCWATNTHTETQSPPRSSSTPIRTLLSLTSLSRPDTGTCTTQRSSEPARHIAACSIAGLLPIQSYFLYVCIKCHFQAPLAYFRRIINSHWNRPRQSPCFTQPTMPRRTTDSFMDAWGVFRFVALLPPNAPGTHPHVLLANLLCAMDGDQLVDNIVSTLTMHDPLRLFWNAHLVWRTNHQGMFAHIYYYQGLRSFRKKIYILSPHDNKVTGPIIARTVTRTEIQIVPIS